MTFTSNILDTVLGEFIGKSQSLALAECLKGEDHSYFAVTLGELTERIEHMPKTYETDGQGENAIAHLHYFIGGWDWFITEKDMEAEQIQAFGLVRGQSTELGYINLQEITAAGAELDLHWEPKPLKEIKS